MTRAFSIATLAMVLAACSQDVLSVRIHPDQYEVGDVKSVLATPAVDEAVRLKADAVHVYACPGTPPAKIIQFQTELAARYHGPMALGVLDASQCPG